MRAALLFIAFFLAAACGGPADCPDLTWERHGWAIFHCGCGDRRARWTPAHSCEDTRDICSRLCQ